MVAGESGRSYDQADLCADVACSAAQVETHLSSLFPTRSGDDHWVAASLRDHVVRHFEDLSLLNVPEAVNGFTCNPAEPVTADYKLGRSSSGPQRRPAHILARPASFGFPVSLEASSFLDSVEHTH